MNRALLHRLPLLLLVWSVMVLPARALTGTWNANPANGDWNMPSNWSSLAPPNGANDIASFGLSSITSVFLSADTEVDRLVFNPGASAYTITASPNRTLTISGAGTVNNSGITQALVAETDLSGNIGTISFTHGAALGSLTSVISNGSVVVNQSGAVVTFLDTSTAGAGSLLADGGRTQAGRGGNIRFFDSSSGGSASLAANGGAVVRGSPGVVDFFNVSTAGQAMLTTKGGIFGGSLSGDIGGFLRFHNQTTAADATIVNSGGKASSAIGGTTEFYDSATASAARITNNGGATDHSLEGATNFYGNATAANSLIVNNGGLVAASIGGTTGFLGSSSAGAATVIANPGPGSSLRVGGSISFEEDSHGGTSRIEVFGNGFLTIRQHNAAGVTIGSLKGDGVAYLGNNNLSIGSNNLSTEFSGVVKDGGPFGPDPTGGSITKIGMGTLTLSGQNTYTGLTTVNAGKLVINGSVLTPVIVLDGILGGSGNTGGILVSAGGALSPGTNAPGPIRVSGNLTLQLGATYLVEVNGAAVGVQCSKADVTGAVDLGDATLLLSSVQVQPGMVFTIIDNDGADAIIGSFGGLTEGGAISAGTQTFFISYQGGDGNDVVLTAVVPEPRFSLLVSIGALIFLFGRRCRSDPQDKKKISFM